MAWQILKQSPVDSSFSQSPDGIIFTWAKNTDTTLEPRIRFKLSTQADLSLAIIDTYLIGVDQYELKTPLDNNVVYYWDCWYEDDTTDLDSVWSFLTKPAEVALISPVGAKDVPTNPTLIFSDSSGFSNYKIEVSLNGNFTGTIDVDLWEYETTELSFTMPDNLPNNTIVYWRVKGYSSSNEGDWSQGDGAFKTTYGIPSVPLLLTPSNNSKDVSLDVVFTWDGADGSTEDVIYIDSDPSFSEPYKKTVVSVKKLTVPDGIISADGLYYWKVVSKNSAGTTTSDVSSFETRGAEQPDNPTPIAPIGNITTVVPLFEWSQGYLSSSDATNQLQVATDSEFTNIIKDITDITSTFYLAEEALEYATVYHWRVRTVSGGLGTAWSAVKEFTTPNEGEGDEPSSPAWIHPTEGQTQLPVNINFQWTAIADALGYNLEVKDSNGNIVIGVGVISNSYQANLIELEYGKEYTATIRAQSSDGFSEAIPVTFRTRDVLSSSSPSFTYPENGDNDVPDIFTMTWEYDMDVWQNPKFRLQLAVDETFSWAMHDESELFATEKTFTWSELTNAYDTFYARVKAYNNSGASEWSSVIRFSKENELQPPKPVIIYPENGQTDVDLPVRIDWPSQDNSWSFQVQIASSSDFSSSDIILFKEGIEDSYLDVTELEINNDYYVRVRGVNPYASGTGFGEWSDVVMFNTDNIGPAGFVKLLKPNNLKTNVILTPEFKWSPGEYAESYRLRLYVQLPQGEKAGAIYEKLDITDTSFTLPAGVLAKNIKYWWTVQGYNKLGFSTNFEYFSFITETDEQPGKPIITYPQNYSGSIPLTPNITWIDENDTAVKYTLEISSDSGFVDLIYKSDYVYADNLDYAEATLDNSEVYTALEYNSKYYARVKGYKSDNGSGDWSDTVLFVTNEEPAPLRPSIITPEKESSVENIFTASWDEAMYANSYHVEIAEKSTFNDIIIEETVESTSIELSLFKGKTYYLRIRGIGNGGYGQYVIIKFKTND